MSGTLEIILTAPITANTTVSVLTATTLSGNFTSVQVTPAPGQQCSLSASQQTIGGGLAALINVGGCPASPGSSTSSNPTSGGGSTGKKGGTNYGLVGGLVGGVVGLFLIVGIVAFVMYKRGVCRSLFKAHEDEMMIT